jgi:hypothetical protein
MNAINAIRSYFIRSNPWSFRESPERIDYHIKHGDYLPLLATMMGFMEEALRNNDSHAANQQKTEIALKLARDLRADLRYVSAHYSLTTRSER